MDIDGNDKDEPKDENEDKKDKEPLNINDICTKLKAFIKCCYNHDTNLTVIQKSDESLSYHVYGDFACSLYLMKYFVRGISDYIDTNVYRSHGSLRMCNSPKYNRDDRTVKKTVYPCSAELYANTIIHNIDNLPVFHTNVGLCRTPHFTSIPEIVIYDASINKRLNELVGSHTLKPVDNNYGYSCIIGHQYKCPVTGNIHESNNGYIFVTPTPQQGVSEV